MPTSVITSVTAIPLIGFDGFEAFGCSLLLNHRLDDCYGARSSAPAAPLLAADVTRWFKLGVVGRRIPSRPLSSDSLCCHLSPM
jgi:hypothetical protein